uniref:THAP-type domain-containing protein n=1 Tax=Anopheles farauti TaxID=69004 RepID=A0A182QIN0_9DIPT
MGGCRCTFQNCENGTANRKDLHYFRYPVRDLKRMDVWMKNANREDLRGLPLDKVCNKVVCQVHFQREMFMNELRERLTKTAVPRLMPQENGSLLNVETGELYPCDDTTEEKSVEEEPKPSSPVQNKTMKMIEHNAMWTAPDEPEVKKIKILNSQSPIVNRPIVDVPCKVIRIKTPATAGGLTMHRRKVPALRDQNPQQQSQRQQKQQEVQIMPIKTLEFNALDNENSTEELLEHHEIDIDGVYLEEVDQTVDGSERSFAVSTRSQQSEAMSASVFNLPQAPSAPVVPPAVLEKLEQNGREIERLQKLVQQLVDRPQAELTVAPTAAPAKVVMEKGPQLTKALLFNGIKRYLNPTMVTLLRMELFAGPSERQWKSDEKSLAVELISMGEQVYDCFQDEFRFRLPPKSEAKQWKESGEIDADDAC